MTVIKRHMEGRLNSMHIRSHSKPDNIRGFKGNYSNGYERRKLPNQGALEIYVREVRPIILCPVPKPGILEEEKTKQCYNRCAWCNLCNFQIFQKHK